MSYINDIAETIRQQLLATTPFNVICSWGAFYGFYSAPYKGMPALLFKVNGRLFKGIVIVAYNDNDTYEVYLRDSKGDRLLATDVYFDMLGDVIDTAIEKGNSEEEYETFCQSEREKLMRGDL